MYCTVTEWLSPSWRLLNFTALFCLGPTNFVVWILQKDNRYLIRFTLSNNPRLFRSFSQSLKEDLTELHKEVGGFFVGR